MQKNIIINKTILNKNPSQKKTLQKTNKLK